jgi:hypothetical protein
MAVRAFSFGLRLRDKGKTVRVHAPRGSAGEFVVEDAQAGRATRRRVHGSLAAAVRDGAATWRKRLH